ncbi:FMN-binding negative transcriptional regulator [Saccharopolyspora soli]|uniref:FMN-binding negative transcriptional regulator n=1 Tax=Saccharopolyspora soli TaxID=2926618 RepID=UPI00241399FA|nr:FMN-binding negative transcriptional regulator [Saccharopolyspora soli]
MYVPAHFAPDDEAVHELLTNHGAADLVTATPDGLIATMLPFIYDRERGTLLGHLARNNDHWRQTVIGDALVIVRGPDSYITPSWYAGEGRTRTRGSHVELHDRPRVRDHDCAR